MRIRQLGSFDQRWNNNNNNKIFDVIWVHQRVLNNQISIDRFGEKNECIRCVQTFSDIHTYIDGWSFDCNDRSESHKIVVFLCGMKNETNTWTWIHYKNWNSGTWQLSTILLPIQYAEEKRKKNNNNRRQFYLQIFCGVVCMCVCVYIWLALTYSSNFMHFVHVCSNVFVFVFVLNTFPFIIYRFSQFMYTHSLTHTHRKNKKTYSCMQSQAICDKYGYFQ